MKILSLAFLLGISFVAAANSTRGNLTEDTPSFRASYALPANVDVDVLLFVMLAKNGLICGDGQLPAWLRDHQQAQVLRDYEKQWRHAAKQQPRHHSQSGNHRSYR